MSQKNYVCIITIYGVSNCQIDLRCLSTIKLAYKA